jgi:hypothetical protein
LRQFLAASRQVGIDQVELVAEMIQRHKGRIEPEELCSQLGLSQTKIMQILTFDGVGYKALSLAIVMEKGLLKPAP